MYSVTLPGETIQETFATMGISNADAAALMGVSVAMLDRIISGAVPISHAIALSLERVTKVPKSFWLNRERDYRKSLRSRDE